MRFLLALSILLPFPAVSLANREAIVLFSENRDILYISSIERENSVHLFTDCFGNKGEILNNQKFTVFYGDNVCVQVSSKYQAKKIEQLIPIENPAYQYAVSVSVPSLEIERQLRKELALLSLKNVKVEIEIGKEFSIINFREKIGAQRPASHK